MGLASYKDRFQASQVNITTGDRDVEIQPRRRGDQPWKSPLQAAANPGQHEEAGQGRGNRNRQGQRQQVCGKEEELFWNVKKCCLVTTLHVPAATLREARVRLRPMNMAGYCLPGMCTPHNTSQYIMDQHEDTWGNKEEAAMFGESCKYSTAPEDFPLMDSVLSTLGRTNGHL